MRKEPFDKVLFIAWLAFVVLGIGILAATLYTAHHFVVKYW